MLATVTRLKLRLDHELTTEVSAASTALFRICLGIVLVFHSLEYATNSELRQFTTHTGHFFYWELFNWVRPLPDPLLITLAWTLFGAALFILSGVLYRPACAIAFLISVYFFLLDRYRTVNHDYFLCLVCLLMVLIPADRMFALARLLSPESRHDTIPRAGLWSLRLQFGIPYFYGGLAKLFEPDWLSGDVTTSIARSAGLLDQPYLFHVLDTRWIPWILAYGGLLFDLLIVPLLIWPRTRLFALAIAVGFHLTNVFIFDIEVFPWLMIAGTLLFLEPDWPLSLFSLSRETPTS